MIHSHFSTSKPVRNENYRGVEHATDSFVGVIARRFSCSVAAVGVSSKFGIPGRKFNQERG